MYTIAGNNYHRKYGRKSRHQHKTYIEYLKTRSKLGNEALPRCHNKNRTEIPWLYNLSFKDSAEETPFSPNLFCTNYIFSDRVAHAKMITFYRVILIQKCRKCKNYHKTQLNQSGFFEIPIELANLPNFSAKLKTNCGCQMVTHLSIRLGLIA